MNLATHCSLCDHQKVDFKKGTICSLTNTKPQFNKTCSKIKLTDEFEKKLKEVNIKFKKVNDQKILVYIYFVIFLSIGLSIIIGGYLLGKYVLGSGVISTVPIIIMGVSLAPLMLAFGNLNNFRQKLDVARTDKEKIDQVLEAYHIDYDIKIKFGKKYHGTQEVSATLNIDGIS